MKKKGKRYVVQKMNHSSGDFYSVRKSESDLAKSVKIFKNSKISAAHEFDIRLCRILEGNRYLVLMRGDIVYDAYHKEVEENERAG